MRICQSSNQKSTPASHLQNELLMGKRYYIRVLHDSEATTLAPAFASSAAARKHLVSGKYELDPVAQRIHGFARVCCAGFLGNRKKVTVPPFPTISDYNRSHTLSIFLIISLAHCTDAAINWSVRGLPCGPPKRSSAVCMCRLARIAAIMPITRLRPSSTWPCYTFRLIFATS